MSRTDRAAKGYAANVVQIVMFIVLQAILAPLVLKFAGVDTLGAFSVLMQVVAYFSLFDMACSVTLARYLAQSSGSDRFLAIFTTGRTCLLISGVVLALLAAPLARPFASSLRLPEAVAWQARASVYLLAAWFIVRVPLASYDDALIATQNLVTANTIAGLQNSARVIGSLIAVLAGAGLLGMVCAMIASDLAAGSLFRLYFFRSFPDRAPVWGFPDRGLLRSMLAFTGRAMLSQLATMLTFASGQVIAGELFGAVGVAVIYTNQLPAQMAHNVIMRLADNASPAINELQGRGDIARLRDAFFRIHRLTMNLAIPLAFALIFFSRSLIALWVGPRQYGGAGMSVALAALTIAIAIEHVNVVFAMCCGLERAVARFSTMEAAVTVGLSFVLGRIWGVCGIPAAVTIAILPKAAYLWKKLPAAAGLGVAQYFAACIVPSTAASTLGLAAAWAVDRWVGMGSWRTAGMAALAFCAVHGAVSYLICLNSEERSMVRKFAAAWQALVPPRLRLRPAGVDAE